MHGPAPVPPAPPSVPTPTAGDAASAALRDAVRQLRRGTAIVIGDAMLDRYLFGVVSRISPEAPVPVLSIEREVALPGGAGNVVRNLTALGAPVAFVSVVGDDPAGSDLTGLVGGQPGVEPWLLVQGGRATTTKTRFLARGQHMLRADREETDPIHPRLADRLIRIAADAVAATSVMVLSDYRKGVLAGDTAPRLIAAARSAGRRVVADFRGGDPARLAGADLVLPELAALAEATGRPVRNAADIAAAAEAFRAEHRLGAALVLGDAGSAILVAVNAAPLHLPGDAGEVIDAAGAADTALAVAAAGLGAGLPLPIAARLAALAAGIAVQKSGIAVVREEDFEEAFAPGRLAARKLASRPQAAERVERWRRGGWRVGFIPAAMAVPALLAEARGWCDRLVVGVAENDAGAAAYAEHATVDLVARFGAEGPIELIRLLRPDVLVQDAERAPETVAGGALLQEWGGEVKRPGLSRL